jgi:hypothetical protein
MAHFGIRHALFLVPALGALACSTTPAEPSGPAPSQKGPSTQTQVTMPVAGLKIAKPQLGDLVPVSLRIPARLVKGTYGRGAVHRWNEIAPADRETAVVRYSPHPVTTRLFFSDAPKQVGDLHEVALPIDAPRDAQIFIVPGGTPETVRSRRMHEFGIELRKPSGEAIVATDDEVHVIDFEGDEDHALPLVGSKFQHVKLDRPTPGRHSLTFKAKAGIERLGAIVTQPHGVELEATTDRDAVVAGEPIVISARVRGGPGQSVADTAIEASVFSRKGQKKGVVALHDDGVAPDAVAADGLYSGVFNPSEDDMEEMGTWSINVEARGNTTDGAPFLRHGSTGFGHTLPLAKLTGLASDRLGEVDGVPAIELMVEVDVAVASRYRLKGVVVGKDGKALVDTSVATELVAGKNRVSLGIPQKYLVDREGPFVVKNLELVSVDTEFPVARIADAYELKSKLTK